MISVLTIGSLYWSSSLSILSTERRGTAMYYVVSRIYRKSTLRWKAHHSGCGYMWTWDDLKNSQMWTPPSTPDATGLLDKTYLQNIVKLFICQIFWLEYIWLKQVGWPLNHCFQKYEATLSQTCAVEFGWTKSSDIFNWLLLNKIALSCTPL